MTVINFWNLMGSCSCDNWWASAKKKKQQQQIIPGYLQFDPKFPVNIVSQLIFKIDLNTLSLGFPGSSAGKESTCNAGRSPGERIGYTLQYSWVSLVAQLVKNLAVMRETWVQSLGWEDPLENGMTTYSSILAWRIPWTVYLWGHKELGMTEWLSKSREDGLMNSHVPITQLSFRSC